MAFRPNNLEANRFALLDPGPKEKKKRKGGTVSTLVPFPMLPESKADDPKFVVVESSEVSKPLSSFSPFAIHRAIKQTSSDVHSISTLRDGKLLLLVKSNTIAQKFIKSKQLVGIGGVSAFFHDSLNHVKGTVFAPFLNNVPEDEIVKELSPQGVVSVFKFKKNVDGNLRPSGALLLTFNLYKLPNKIDIAWANFIVREYFPTPMRCKSCQLLGHTAKHCKNSPVCVNCSLPPHSPTNCTRTSCANCRAEHSSSSKDCTKFIQAKEILKIKTIKKCSMREALKIYKETIPPLQSGVTFANVISNTNSQQKPQRKQQQQQPNSTSAANADTANNNTNKKSEETNNSSNQNSVQNLSFNCNVLQLSSPTITDTTQSISFQDHTSLHQQNNHPSLNNASASLNSATPTSALSPQLNSPTQTTTSDSPTSHLNSLFVPLPSLSKVLASQDVSMTDEEIS